MTRLCFTAENTCVCLFKNSPTDQKNLEEGYVNIVLEVVGQTPAEGGKAVTVMSQGAEPVPTDRASPPPHGALGWPQTSALGSAFRQKSFLVVLRRLKPVFKMNFTL